MTQEVMHLESAEDPHLWLEEVEDEKALAWVREQNLRTLGELEADAEFAENREAAIEVLTSQERIPYGRVRNGKVYNFWQDDENVRGLWRRTSKESYSSDSPEWEVVLDLDALSKEEGKNWVFKGSDTYRDEVSGTYFCLVSLSDGGKDAVIKREFDLDGAAFVDGGFVTPEAKQHTSWLDGETLLIATDWGEGSLTDSGYPRIVKRWKRGTPLSQAKELIQGDVSDVAVYPYTLELDDGRVLACAEESDTFFTSTHWLLSGNEEEPLRFPIPPKISLYGVYQGSLLLSLKEDWKPKGQGISFESGDLVAFNLDEFLATKELPSVELIFRPNETQAVNFVSIASGAALLSINENVTGKILRLERKADEWFTSSIALPGTGQTSLVFADRDESVVFLNYEDFLTPDSLLEYDCESGETGVLKQLPPKFDVKGLEVEQFFVPSTDGTQIPYFVVRKKGIKFDGSTPTLLYGYGGFQISMRPSYNGVTGRLWLEKGGAYVLANIRGGGEFGPAWHQSGLKGNRQRIYDDFIAVAEDLIDREMTSPEHLGIMGGSNGGLLMGVMLNQRPDLWNAVVIQVPLLDMLRYHLLLAGASWVDEYGSPDLPEERVFLEKISPYHNFNADKSYPTPFFVTSTKDDRVHPGHARKLARKFEEAGLPFYYYENIDGGHSAAANQVERAKRSALEFTYLTKKLF